MIFVSVAAYRDPQLVPTIEDCLAQAQCPDQLRFGICWQHGPEEPALPFARDPRFTILDVDWRNSRGVCWARAEIMKTFRNEDWFLQLDSHHRFTPEWDARALAQAGRTGSTKPILTTYASPFHPDQPKPYCDDPMQMNFDRFTADGIVLFRPGPIDASRRRTRPVRARSLSGHFLFAPGSFVHDVPYDPELYFIGEEITLAIRAFTHGYDFFHPTEVIVWHEYTRDYRPHKHWSDHLRVNGLATEWHALDRTSLDKVRRFLEQPTIGPFACGTARTFEEYEEFAGVSFRHRRAKEYTRAFLEPPNPAASGDWAGGVGSYDVEIALDRAALPRASDDSLFWYVGFHDSAGSELLRADADQGEVLRLLVGGDDVVVIRRTIEFERQPTTWTVWPYSKERGWLTRFHGPIRGWA